MQVAVIVWVTPPGYFLVCHHLLQPKFFASQPGVHLQHGSGDGLEIDAAAEDWGGMRRLSGDKGKVIAQSMGWSNNPESMNHNKLTAADHRMRKAGIWKRWGVI